MYEDYVCPVCGAAIDPEDICVDGGALHSPDGFTVVDYTCARCGRTFSCFADGFDGSDD